VQRRVPHRVVRLAGQTILDVRVCGGDRRVVAGTDRRGAEDPERARLPAVPVELRPVVDDDVVGVEPGETRVCRKADEVRLSEQSESERLTRDATPVLCGEVVGPVDVDVANAEAADVDEIGAYGIDRPSRVWLELNRDLQPPLLRRVHDGRKQPVLERATTPPRAHDLVDPGLRDVTHLPVQDPRVVTRIGAARRIEGGGDVERRRVPALRPVAVVAVVAEVRVPRVEEDRCLGGGRPGSADRGQGKDQHDGREESPHRA
jgi:hypothetical protein